MNMNPLSPDNRQALALALLVALNSSGPGATLAAAQVAAPGAPMRIGTAMAAPLSAPLAALSAAAPVLAPSALPSAALPSATPLSAAAAPQAAPAASAPAEVSRITASFGEALEAVGPVAKAKGEDAAAFGARAQRILNGERGRSAPRAAEGPAPVAAAAAEQTPEQRVLLRTLKQVVALYTEHYAPIEWKKGRGVDYKAGYEKIRARVLAEPRLPQREFQKLLAQFVAETSDYHAGISFYSTEAASLPLTILGAGGRYYIAVIDRDALPESRFPYQLGDEVVEFGGRPTAQAAAALIRSPNTSETDARRSELGLTRRSRRAGSDVPKGDIALKIRTEDGSVHQAKLTWKYSPELLPVDVPVREGGIGPESASGDGPTIAPAPSPERAAARELLRRVFPSMAASDAAQLTAQARSQSESNQAFMIGGKTSFVPVLGEVVWRLPQRISDQIPFTAYIYKDKQGRRIGYLRVPDYSGNEKLAAIFQQIIAHFEQETDGLVLDQVNNPGGSVFYMYSLLSMLADKPLTVPGHRLLIGEDDAALAAQILQQAENPSLRKMLEREFEGESEQGEGSGGPGIDRMVAYAHAILDQLKAGNRLTDPKKPIPLLGVSQIRPAETHYTKPIVVLINELDFSAGDFLPSILQDNKRATLFGVRTAGAGGAVKSVQLPNQSGIERVSYTWTIAQRLNGQPIENLGVKPDVGHAITAEDIRGGFAGYARALNAAIAERVEAPRPGQPVETEDEQP